MTPSITASVAFAAVIFALNASSALAQHSARAENGNRVSVPGMQQPSATQWGSLDQMIDLVWYTEGLPIQRMSVFNWSVRGEVLIIRHGPTSRMRLNTKYADTVQRIALDARTGKYLITYSYEDDRTLSATGTVAADGTFVETLTGPDGVVQRNRYVRDSDKRMRIVREKQQGAGWVQLSVTVKTGETLQERQAKEFAEQQRREAIAAERAAQYEAKRLADLQERENERLAEEQRFAEEEAAQEAELAERVAQQQRSWQIFQDDMQGVVRQYQKHVDDSQRFQQQVADNVVRQQDAQRQPSYQSSQTVQPRTGIPAASGSSVYSSGSSNQRAVASEVSSGEVRKPPPPAYVRAPNLPQTKAPAGFWDSNEYVSVSNPSEATAIFDQRYGNDRITETLASGCYPDGQGGYGCQRRVRRTLTQNQRGRAE